MIEKAVDRASIGSIWSVVLDIQVCSINTPVEMSRGQLYYVWCSRERERSRGPERSGGPKQLKL